MWISGTTVTIVTPRRRAAVTTVMAAVMVAAVVVVLLRLATAGKATAVGGEVRATVGDEAMAGTRAGDEATAGEVEATAHWAETGGGQP